MTQRKAELALAMIVLVNSTAFLFTKMGIAGIQPLNLVAIRMLVAFAALAVFFLPRLRRVNRATVALAAALGACMFALMALQAYGLTTLSTSEGSFLASTTVVFVPIMMALLTRKMPGRSVVISVMLTLAGVALICGIGPGADSSGLTPGAAMYLIGAVVYGVHVIVVDRAGQQVDILAATVLEMLFVGLFALVGTFAFETPQLPTDAGTWGAVMALALFSTAVGMGFQPLVQQFSSPERYGVLFGLSPLFATMLGVLVLGETLTAGAIAGAALVLAGVMVSELAGTSLHRRLQHLVMPYLPVGRVIRSARIRHF